MKEEWKHLRISDFCKTGSGGTPSRKETARYYGGKIPWVKSGELKEDVILDTQEYITDVALAETSVRMVPEGALLVAMYGATVGRIAILGIPATTNQAVCHIIPGESIADRRYLYYALRKKVPEWLGRRVGGAQPNISQRIIKDTHIPLPPLPVQRRIAAVLDKADALRRKRRRALDKLDELLQAVFLDMFGDPVTNPKGWEVGTVEKIVQNPRNDVRCGPFGTQLKVSELVNEGVPLIGIENVLNDKFDSSFRKFLTPRKAEQLSRFDALPGDVLITRMGTIGRACVVPEGLNDARISYHLFRVRPDYNKCLPSFLAATISRSGVFKAQLKRLSHGAIMSGLSTADLKEVQFLIPPITAQRKYVDYVRKVESTMEHFGHSFSNFDNLFNALMQKAFKGELNFASEAVATMEQEAENVASQLTLFD